MPIIRWSLTAIFIVVFIGLSLRQLKRQRLQEEAASSRSAARSLMMRATPLSDAEYQSRRAALTKKSLFW